jgi:predicted esterase
MTRFQRDQAIVENRSFVDRVITQLKSVLPKGIPIILTGFSQGAAMAHRAAGSANHPPSALVILGGDVPPDVAQDETLSLPPVLLGRGREDPFYSHEQFTKDRRTLESKGAKVRSIEFDGGHEWSAEFVSRVGEFLVEVVGD